MISNHENLCWQFEWSGTQLINKRILVSADELDKPQRQLGTFILPPDPVPVMNARPEQYAIDEYPVSTLADESGRVLVIGYRPYPVEIIVNVQGNLAIS